MTPERQKASAIAKRAEKIAKEIMEEDPIDAVATAMMIHTMVLRSIFQDETAYRTIVRQLTNDMLSAPKIKRGYGGPNV